MLHRRPVLLAPHRPLLVQTTNAHLMPRVDAMILQVDMTGVDEDVNTSPTDREVEHPTVPAPALMFPRIDKVETLIGESG